ncbi:hypothetical protein T484DRAFT_1964081 [Baffinella frigidus]|nr:hypothetical protein T484DRAFT_1964081 [Cryptophyta sp. CCMP2293]
MTDAGRRGLPSGMAARRRPSLFLAFLALSALLHPAGVKSAVPDAVDAFGRRQVLATPGWASFFAAPAPLVPPAGGKLPGPPLCLFAIGGMQNPPETESGKQDSIEEDEEDFDEEAVMIREEKEKVPTEAERFCSPTVESLALRGDREEATGGGGVDRVGAGEHGADKGCGLWVGGWEAGPSLQLGARCHHAVVSCNATLVVIGGVSALMPTGALATVESWSPSQAWLSLSRFGQVVSGALGERKWADEPPMRQTTLGRLLASVESFNVEQKVWSSEPPLPSVPPPNPWGRMGHAAVVIDGRIYVTGGYAGYKASDTGFVPVRLSAVASWAPGEFAWREEAATSVGRSGHAAVAHRGAIWILGHLLPISRFLPDVPLGSP